ncbi:MAG: ankyrin repeat domain-containing protein [Candidatus Amoebophilus sp.]
MLQRFIKRINNIIGLLMVLTTFSHCDGKHKRNVDEKVILSTPITAEMVQLASDTRRFVLLRALQLLRDDPMHAVKNSNSTDIVQLYSDALHQAISLGHLPIIGALLYHQINSSTLAQNGFSPLHYAVFQKNEVIFQLLINQDHININLRDAQGNTPLHLAVLKGCFNMVEILLLREEVDVNSVNNSGSTVLHLATSQGNVKAIKQLLNCLTLDINIQDIEDQSPLHLAIHWGDIAILDVLLVRKDFQLNLRDNKGHTPLHLAVLKDDGEKVTRLLQESDIDVNIQDNHGNTPLHLATKKGYWSITAALRAKGAKLDLKNDENKIPAQMASNFKNYSRYN